MVFTGAIRSGLRVLSSSEPTIFKSGTRGLHSTGAQSSGHSSDPFYMHAKHMYNLDRMKHQKVKMSVFVFSCFSIGVAVPIYAVVFQQHKTASG